MGMYGTTRRPKDENESNNNQQIPVNKCIYIKLMIATNYCAIHLCHEIKHLTFLVPNTIKKVMSLIIHTNTRSI